MSCLIKFIFSILTLVTVFFQAVPAIATNQDAERHFYVELEAGPVWQSNNDTVYNFAWFRYAFISLGYRF